jgi:rubrerythrin
MTMALDSSSVAWAHVEPPLSRTYKSLGEVFALETQYTACLTYFATIAEIEGRTHSAQLFRSLAELHALHAHGHLDLLRRTGDPVSGLSLGLTRANLRAAIETQETVCLSRYSTLSATAQAEGFLDVADWLDTLAKTARFHGQRLREALDNLPESCAQETKEEVCAAD